MKFFLGFTFTCHLHNQVPVRGGFNFCKLVGKDDGSGTAKTFAISSNEKGNESGEVWNS